MNIEKLLLENPNYEFRARRGHRPDTVELALLDNSGFGVVDTVSLLDLEDASYIESKLGELLYCVKNKIVPG